MSKVKKKTVLTGNHLYWSHRFFAAEPIKSLYGTQKLYAVSNFPALAALMKPVTHLTSKERIYNPPVRMKRLNLSSNRLIFSTELQRRTEVSFIGAWFESHRLGILSAFQLKSATC